MIGTKKKGKTSDGDILTCKIRTHTEGRSISGFPENAKSIMWLWGAVHFGFLGKSLENWKNKERGEGPRDLIVEVDIKYYLFKKRSIFDDLKDILDLKANIGSSKIGDKSQDPPFLVTHVHVWTARRTKSDDSCTEITTWGNAPAVCLIFNFNHEVKRLIRYGWCCSFRDTEVL